MSSGTTTSSFAPDDGVRIPNTSAELQLTQLELLLQQHPPLLRIQLLTQQLQRATAELQQGNGFATEPPEVAVQAALTADERASHPAQANSEDSPRSESTADEPVPEMSHVEPRASVRGPVDLDVADKVNADAIAAMQKREQMLKEKADVADGVPQSDDGDNNGTAEANTLRGIDSPSPHDDETAEDAALDVDADGAHEQGDINRDDKEDVDGAQLPAPPSLADTPAAVDKDVIVLTGDESDDSTIAVPDSDHDHTASEHGDASNTSIKKRRPSPYRCTSCRETGHNKRKCPRLARVVSHNSIGDPGAQAPAPNGVVRTTGSVEVNPAEEGRTAQAQSAQDPALPPQPVTVCRPDVYRIPRISPDPPADPRLPRKRRLQAISEQETNDPNRLDHVQNGEGNENVRPRDDTCNLPNQCPHGKRIAKKARIEAPRPITDVMRGKARDQFLEAMKTVQGDASSGPARDESELAAIAWKVEEQLHLLLRTGPTKEYTRRVRSLQNNLKNNHDLRANVLSGKLRAYSLVRMPVTDLATKDLQAMRAEREARIGEDAFLPEPGADPQTGIDLDRQHREARQK